VEYTSDSRVSMATPHPIETTPTTMPATSEPKPGDRPEEITRTRSGMSYVVMGIYSTESNARRAVAQATKQYAIPESDFRLFRYGKKWLVSLGEVEKRAEAQEIARRYRTEYGAKEVWVYSKP